MELQLLFKITATVAVIGFFSTVARIFHALILKPERLRSKLRKQGIRGPPPSVLLGNTGEMRRMQSKVSEASRVEDGHRQIVSHNCSSILFPFFEKWEKEYGSTFMFSLGNLQILHMNNPDVVKEISTCTSLDFGKPSYQQRDRGPLLGQGILTSNGAKWAYQRKIIAPELYLDKVKGMVNLMVESSMTLVKSWTDKIESDGGVSNIKIDTYMRSFSGDVISRACFGSSYLDGEEIFLRLRALQEAMSKKVLSTGIPLLRYLPTKHNKEVWRLEKEVRTLILKAVEERQRATSLEKDLLQMILESARGSDLGKDATDSFIVDNCKNIYAAGYETTAVSATWTLMLLASNPEWQDRVRAEVAEICQGQLPDNNMIRKMKVLTMVIYETLRLYPPVCVISREALQDMKFGDIHVPKGVNVWVLSVTLHLDPAIWGPDANKFNPDRFANGVNGACKLPHVYMPFGAGPRTCLGQNLAMAELKILISIIVSKFSFTLSPTYVHSPVLSLVTEPKHGVDLLVRKVY